MAAVLHIVLLPYSGSLATRYDAHETILVSLVWLRLTSRFPYGDCRHN